MTSDMQRHSKSKGKNVVSNNEQQSTTAKEQLKKPYGRLLVPETEGGYRAEILEFPGCIAEGDTAAEAVGNLEDAAESWLESTIERRQAVPQPMEELDYSGKLVVRLPKSLHRRAAYAANRDGISLNQFIVSAIAEQVGLKARPQYFQPQMFMQMNVCNNFQHLLVGSVQLFPGTNVTASSSDRTDPFVLPKPREQEHA